MTSNALYTDLSGYYDLMCADIDYLQQSHTVHRLQQLFGNNGRQHLDLACGTGPHVAHFIDFGYQSGGLDINQPMLDLAQTRCPDADFSLQDMCSFSTETPPDLITCFLYSIHYSAQLERLSQCIASAHAALNAQGLFCFNAVDKHKIDNNSFVSHSAQHGSSLFKFASNWHYKGSGNAQALMLSIDKTDNGITQSWQDSHSMVAVSFSQLQQLLEPYFDVHIFEHDYDKLVPWQGTAGNALFACVKK
ncbi:class I SAM-dependent DNA methyltransferase [Pseudoalteromonas tunicata]|uniref:class I SAM-dependent DNA methyltransferase n=1 Tax=Pseudoalteromonas tunicata TaxID=314281 RepID=UPI00273F45D7|nr:class I SAM-dependent methyltransferase [Pseudoalteromonas tunicata]MDP4985774.1 class I SAM-dependent methyltransferase [Pseudoalteromonas tunicata]